MEPVPPPNANELEEAPAPVRTADRSLRPSVDELSEASFPASDPPPSWIWEPATTR